jgi:carboxyl-terminal processing protease
MQRPTRSRLRRSFASGLLLGGCAGLAGGLTLSLLLSAPAAGGASPYPHFDLFAEVFHRIRTTYVEQIPSEQLVDAAVRGMVKELDPHSSFMNPDQFKALRDDNRGQYVGVGLELEVVDGNVGVKRVIEGGPAADAGFMPGDVFISIDEVSVEGAATSDVSQKLRGPRGVTLTVVVSRKVEGVATEVTLRVTRDTIRTEALTSRFVAPGYGMVSIGSFQADVGERLRAAIDDLEAENEGELRGLILDLRNNPGGLLAEAISVADAFLDDGVIVSTRGRQGGSSEEFAARRSDTRYRGPLVVLVNAGSASASEVVAGALQDSHRAIVVGNQTYGKGSVQSIVELPEGYGMKLTTSLYYAPSGRSIQNDGITPDLVLDSATAAAAPARPVRRERDLDGALPNPAPGKGDELGLGAIDDLQVRAAVNQLVAIDRFVGRGR